MNLSGRPLLDNTADQALFVGRDEQLRRIEQSLRSGLNCLVVGDPGSGKTSLVRALMYRVHQRADDLRFAYVRGAAARNASELLDAVLAAVSRDAARAARSAGAGAEPADLVNALIDAVDGSTAGPLVIIVEDVAADAGLDLFGALRDELWQVDARWLVTASTVQAATLLRAPADVFFDVRLRLEPLTAEETGDLLRRRLDELDDAGLRPIIDGARAAGPLTPRRLLELARDLAADPTVGGAGLTTVEGLRERTAVLDTMSRPARMLAQELESLGWASASDERLLDRMGWTRPRVVQVMGELERRGLIQMREESTGRGRPRKMFRMVPPAEFGGSIGSGGSGAPSGPDASGGSSRSGGSDAP